MAEAVKREGYVINLMKNWAVRSQRVKKKLKVEDLSQKVKD
jgi:hypothetical protein